MERYEHLKAMISTTIASTDLPRNHYSDVKSRTKLLLEAAEKNGWEVFPVWNNTWLFLEGDSVVGGTYQHALSNQVHLARTLATHKEATKLALQRIGVPVPSGKVYETDALQTALKDFVARERPQIMKPTTGSTSTGVTLSLPDEDSFIEAWGLIRETIPTSKILVEDLVDGFDIRVLVINGSAVAAASRINPFVVGDGRTSLGELIELRETDRTQCSFTKRFSTPVDRDFIAAQGVDMEKTIPENDVILLNRSINLVGGRESLDVTDLVSPSLLKLAENATRAMPFQPIVGVDIMTTSLSANTGVVLELNVQPHFDLHHYVTYGNSRNVAASEIDSLKSAKSSPQIGHLAEGSDSVTFTGSFTLNLK